METMKNDISLVMKDLLERKYEDEFYFLKNKEFYSNSFNDSIKSFFIY